jgi:hypothetical protein
MLETKFVPEKSDLIPLDELLKTALITDDDVNNYIKDWDKNNVEYAGLLEAEIVAEE